MNTAVLVGHILFNLVLVLLSAAVALGGSVLLTRAVMGTDMDDKVEEAGYHAPWKLALMGVRAPVMPARVQLVVVGIVATIGLAILALQFV